LRSVLAADDFVLLEKVVQDRLERGALLALRFGARRRRTVAVVVLAVGTVLVLGIRAGAAPRVVRVFLVHLFDLCEP
jgi:hypothetical protein